MLSNTHWHITTPVITLLITSQAFGILRIFALSNRSWIVTLPATILGLVPTAMNIVRYSSPLGWSLHKPDNVKVNYIEVDISRQRVAGDTTECETTSLLSPQINLRCVGKCFTRWRRAQNLHPEMVSTCLQMYVILHAPDLTR